jgi:hypothetical protein
LYDLILINVEKDSGHLDRFCEDLRDAIPRQPLAFLVGKPGYVAGSPNLGEDPVIGETNEQAPSLMAHAADADDPEVLPRHWGIMEASRRICAVRSAAIAHTRAMRALPPPPRDSEERPAKPTARPTSLDDLLRKELR